MTSTSVAVGWNGNLALDPSPEEIEAAASLHILGFSSHGDLIISESEGSFGIEVWEQVLEIAGTACCVGKTSDNVPESDNLRTSKHQLSLEGGLRATILKRIQDKQRWR